MILFPLMTTWIWFQILTASPLASSGLDAEFRVDSGLARSATPALQG